MKKRKGAQMSWWKKIVKCYNPYQGFSDWARGRFRCPKCGQFWYSLTSIFDDATAVTVEKGKVSERRVQCPDFKCGFEEVVWRLD